MASREEIQWDTFLFSCDYFLPTNKSAYSIFVVLQITLNDAFIL